MKKTSPISVKFTADVDAQIRSRAIESSLPVSRVIEEATRIGLPWLAHPPRNSIADELLKSLGIAQELIVGFRGEVARVTETVQQIELGPAPTKELFAALIAKLTRAAESAKQTESDISRVMLQMKARRPLSHNQLTCLKKMAITQRDHTLDPEEKASYDEIIRALDQMGVA